MKISLESYAPVAVVDNFDEVLMDQVAANEAFLEASAEFDKVMTSVEIYSEIGRAIKVCGGVTKSIEVMFGENFSGATSMEGETWDKVKAGANKAWEWIKKMFAKLVDFFKTVFSTVNGAIEKLKAAEKALTDNKESELATEVVYTAIEMLPKKAAAIKSAKEEFIKKYKEIKIVDDESAAKVEQAAKDSAAKVEETKKEEKPEEYKTKDRLSILKSVSAAVKAAEDHVNYFKNLGNDIKAAKDELDKRITKDNKISQNVKLRYAKAILTVNNLFTVTPTWFIRSAAVQAGRIVKELKK